MALGDPRSEARGASGLLKFFNERSSMVEIRNGDGWFEVYVNDRLILEGHSFQACDLVDLLNELGIEHEQPEGNFCDYCGTWVPGLCSEEICPECALREEDT